MIKKFSKYKLSENDSSDESYINDLTDEISKLKEKIDLLEDEIADLEKSIQDKEDKIYSLEDSYESLLKVNNNLEKEIETFEKQEAKLMQDKKDLDYEINLYNDPYSALKKGDENDKLMMGDVFLGFLDSMEDLPIAFGHMLRIKSKSNARYKRLLYNTLKKEWVDAYFGPAGEAMTLFGIDD